MNNILYKYKTIDNWKYILDIFIKKRLYAAKYTELNDPMEGQYFYKGNAEVRELEKKLREEKQIIGICSFSKNYNSTLMWSHYANSHRGIVLGVRIGEKACIIEEVKYVDSIAKIDITNNWPRFKAQEILTYKLSAWNYENEYRVIGHMKKVRVEIVELFLGCKIRTDDEEIIKSLAEKYLNDVKIRKMEKEDLDHNNFLR